jgi:hypothetical protein
MLTYKHVDDGWFCKGYWIFDGDDVRFAEADTEDAAIEIVDAINTARYGEPVNPARAAELRKRA